MREFASFIKDEMIADLSDVSRNLMLSIDILPIPTDEAVKEIQQRILGIETDIARWQQRQNNHNNFAAAIPYELEQQRTETKEFLDDLMTRDQRMMFAVVTLVHGQYYPSEGNGGTYAQKSNCYVISEADALPGDLVFAADIGHVGIVGGRADNGDLLIIHCTSGTYNNVVITEMTGFFSIVARPRWY